MAKSDSAVLLVGAGAIIVLWLLSHNVLQATAANAATPGNFGGIASRIFGGAGAIPIISPVSSPSIPIISSASPSPVSNPTPFAGPVSVPGSPAQGICFANNEVIGPLKISPILSPNPQSGIGIGTAPGSLPIPVPVGQCTTFLGLSPNPTIALTEVGAPLTRTVLISGQQYTFSGNIQQVQEQINAQLAKSGTNVFQTVVAGAIPGGGVVA